MNLLINKKILKYLISNSFQLILFFLIGFFCYNSQTLAQFGPDSVAEFSEAPVIIDGHELFLVRGIPSYPAEDRAKTIKERIENVANDYSIRPEKVDIVHSEIRDDIFISGKFIMSVFDVDAQLVGIEREVLSAVIKRNLTKAIYNYRHERTSETIINRALYAAGATLIIIFILLLIHWGIKKTHTLLERKLKAKIESLESKSFNLIRSNQLWLTIYSLSKVIKLILVLIILFIYLEYLLSLFPWTRGISISLIGIFITPLREFGISILNFIPNLAFLIVIFFVTKYILKLTKIFFNGIEQGNIKIHGFDAEWSLPTYKILRVFILLFGVIIAYPYIPGSDSDAFKGVSLFLGLLISLGSSSIIGNLIAGYSMIYRRTFRKGDLVKIDNYIGQVIDTKLFITRLHTPKNEEIVIPNSVILNNHVVNYSSLAHDRGLILHTDVGIGYETSWRQVEEMLKVAAERSEGFLKDPPPFILQKALGDFAVTYELNVYCKDPHNMLKLYTKLHQNILDVFNENNVQIMTPAYERDPEEPKVVPKDKWYVPLIGKTKSEGDKK